LSKTYNLWHFEQNNIKGVDKDKRQKYKDKSERENS